MNQIKATQYFRASTSGLTVEYIQEYKEVPSNQKAFEVYQKCMDNKKYMTAYKIAEKYNLIVHNVYLADMALLHLMKKTKQ